MRLMARQGNATEANNHMYIHRKKGEIHEKWNGEDVQRAKAVKFRRKC